MSRYLCLEVERPTTPAEPSGPVECIVCGDNLGDPKLEYCDKCNDPLCLDCSVVIADEVHCRRCARKAMGKGESIPELAQKLWERIQPMIEGYRIAGIRPPKPEDAIFVELQNGCLITLAERVKIDASKACVILEREIA